MFHFVLEFQSWKKVASYPLQLLCRTVVFADLWCIFKITSHHGSPCLRIIRQDGCYGRECNCVCVCVFPMSFPQSHPPTGTIVSPYPIKTIAKTGIQTSARACVWVCVCVHACVCALTNPHIRTNAHKYTGPYSHTHTHTQTGQRKSNFKINPLGGKKGGWKKKEWEPPNLHQCWLIVKDCQLLQPSIGPKGSSRIQLGAQ